jgi:hypothetical protein
VSANKSRKAGAPAFPKRRPELRLVKSPDERPRRESDPELKAILDDMKRRHSERDRRAERNPDDKDAA